MALDDNPHGFAPLSVVDALRILGAPTSHLSAARNMRLAVTKRLAYDAAAKGNEVAVVVHLREAQRLLEGG
jgi:hypothetical protein